MNRRLEVRLVRDGNTVVPGRLRDAYEVYDLDALERVGALHYSRPVAEKHAARLGKIFPHPQLFVDTKIAAILRALLHAQDWIPQTEISRIYGQQTYGRSDLYHRQAGDKGWIRYENRPTGTFSKSTTRHFDGTTSFGQPLRRTYWHWNLGTIPRYFELMSDKQLMAAFVFCEDGVLHRVRDKDRVWENRSYSEGGRVFTPHQQWGVWLQCVEREIARRSNR